MRDDGVTSAAGEIPIEAPALLIGDRTRARILLALSDGRALPVSVLAAECGLAMSTISGHLAKLVDGGLLTVRRQGRHRYYSLASAEVAEAVEALARLAPPPRIRSLRSGTRAHALRMARSCYGHLAGRLGIELMDSLIRQGMLVGGDGRHHPDSAKLDRLSAPGRDVSYSLTDAGWQALAELGVDRDKIGQPAVRYCVDWTEQRHHVAGALGTAVLHRLLELGWLKRAAIGRALQVQASGREGLRHWLAIDVDDIEARDRDLHDSGPATGHNDSPSTSGG